MKTLRNLLLAVTAVMLTLSGTSCKKEELKVELQSIKINPDALALVEGDQKLLKVQLVPEELKGIDIIWESVDESIAEVNSDGKVTALAEGQTSIMATSPEFNMTAKCKVSVSKKIIPAKEVKLDPEKLTLDVKETATLKAEVLPENTTDKTIVWSSDHPEIATVEDGTVTGVKPGTATITAKCGERTASCEVTVNIIGVTTFGIVCPTGGDQLELGEQTALTVKIEPADATIEEVTWKSDQPEVASVDDKGMVTALRQGTATITASVSQGEKNYEATQKIEVSGDLKITNYPNMTGIYWGCKRTFTAGNKSDGAAREVTWSIEFVDVTDPENCGTSIDPVSGEVTCMPKVVNGEPQFENYEFRIIATAKDNGSTAEKTLESMYWKAIVESDRYGTVAPADHIFKRGDEIYISYHCAFGAMDQGVIKDEMTIDYNTAKLYHYANEIWELYVKDDAPAGPETITVNIGEYQQSFTINIESTEAAVFDIKANLQGALWGESIQFTAENGTVSKWEVFRPRLQVGKEGETHLSEIDQNGKLKVKEYVKAKATSLGGISTKNIFKNSELKVTATSTDGKEATATVQSYYWKIQLYLEDGTLYDPNDQQNLIGVGEILTVKIQTGKSLTPGTRVPQWTFTAPEDGLKKIGNSQFEVLEGGGENSYVISATLGSVTQTYTLGGITL